jgi:F0F1-type ATP synthase epsilon subunit
MDPNNLSVTVRSRDGVMFEGECKSVSSYNAVGKFDILGKHANFISLISTEIKLITNTGEERTIALNNGVCKVRENKVTIFLGIKNSL